MSIQFAFSSKLTVTFWHQVNENPHRPTHCLKKCLFFLKILAIADQKFEARVLPKDSTGILLPFHCILLQSNKSINLCSNKLAEALLVRPPTCIQFLALFP